MFNKKANIPVVKVISILITTTILFIFWVFILQPGGMTDERKINTQLVVNKLLSGNCFSQDYDTIEESKFTTENLNDCLINSNKIFLRVEVSGNQSVLYLESENSDVSAKKEFENKARDCSVTSSIMCSELRYPVVYRAKDNSNSIQELTIYLITT